MRHMQRAISLLAALSVAGLLMAGALIAAKASLPFVLRVFGRPGAAVTLLFILLVAAAPAIYRRIRTRGFFSVEL